MLRKLFFYSHSDDSFFSSDDKFIISFSHKGFAVFRLSANSESIYLLGDYEFEFNENESIRNKPDFERFFSGQIVHFLKNSVAKLIVCPQKSFLVPEEIFDEQHIEDYVRAIVSDNISTSQLTHHLLKGHNFEGVLVSLVPQWQYDFIDFLNLQPEVLNFNEVFIQSVLNRKVSQGAFLHVFENEFLLCVIQNGNFVFYNSFCFFNAKDFCYFLVGSLRTVFDSIAQVPVYVSGNIMMEGEILGLVSKYLPNLQYLFPPGEASLPEISLHRYYVQFSTE